MVLKITFGLISANNIKAITFLKAVLKGWLKSRPAVIMILVLSQSRQEGTEP